MPVRGGKAVTGSAAKRLHVEFGRFPYDDGHSTRFQAVIWQTQGDPAGLGTTPRPGRMQYRG